jgi:hypothetical protein
MVPPTLTGVLLPTVGTGGGVHPLPLEFGVLESSLLHENAVTSIKKMPRTLMGCITNDRLFCMMFFGFVNSEDTFLIA